MFGFCVLTTSDRCADGKMDDISGELAVELLSNYGFLLIEKQIVPDDFHKITSTLETVPRCISQYLARRLYNRFQTIQWCLIQKQK